MARSDDPRYQYAKERERIEEALSAENAEPVLQLLDALDPEERGVSFEHGGETKELSSNSLEGYGRSLRLFAAEADAALLELENDDLDELFGALLDGSAEIGPDDGYTKGSVAQYESALKAFYRYHDGHDVDAEAIPIETQEKSGVDDRDLWEVDEISAMRSVIDSKLNEAIFEYLAYTGQRIRILQTTRVRDVDPEHGKSGRYYVNENVEGRKNREGHGPLLGARGAIRRWLQVHPTGDPDDALITVWSDDADGTPGGSERGKAASQNTIRRRLRKVRDRAAEAHDLPELADKKVHPHMFRHYFTTIALRPESRGGFGMDPQYVKRLRGDAPGSTTMETTYAHLIDEDASAHAEEKFGGEPVETALTPAAPCGNCGNMLESGDRACRICGATRAPDAEEGEVELLRQQLAELRAIVET